MTGKVIKVQGSTKLKRYYGVSAFVTTGTTLELDVPFGSIVNYHLDYVGAPAASDGPLSVNEAVDTAGRMVRDASGNVTVQRPAGTTSGQKFYFCFDGY